MKIFYARNKLTVSVNISALQYFWIVS